MKYSSCSIGFIMFSFLVTSLTSSLEEEWKENCVFINHLEISETVMRKQIENVCVRNKICDKTFKIIYVDMMPYTEFGIEYMLKICCGYCTRFNKTIISNITQLTPEMINTTDFVYPILSSPTTSTLYNAHYLPFVEVPSTMYITREEKVDILYSILAMSPLVLVCLLMALISGFIGWILETWANPNEFQRPFLIGWFEGFWWSFVSMTTVGYGDKTPKSIPGRLFSVVWIIIGIVAFGVITGEITGKIVQANYHPSATMENKRVGVLHHRDYDAYTISQGGGIVVRNDYAANFEEDLFNLIKKFQYRNISGFVLDKWTLWYVAKLLHHRVNSTYKDQVIFFLTEALHIEVYPPDEKLSYGILVKNKNDLDYFKEYAEDSQLRSKLFYEEKWMKEKIETFGSNFHPQTFSLLFDVSGTHFQKAIMGITLISSFIVVFGLVYELRRKGIIPGKLNIPVKV